MKPLFTGAFLITAVLLLPLIFMSSACIPLYTETNNTHAPGYCLTIRQYPGMEPLASFPLEKENQFALSFVHSVTVTPVRDNYIVTAEGICQTSEIFESHCAGLPYSDKETDATKWEQRDGKFILHMERKIPKLVVRTDKNYKNRLHLPDQIIDLNQWEDQALLLEITPVDIHQ